MNKREVVWLIVKLIGAYFIYLAFVSLFSLVSSAAALNSSASVASSVNSNTSVNVAPAPVGFPPKQENVSNGKLEKPIDPAAEKAKTEAIKILLWYVLLTAIYGLIGFYLIRDGRILFELLNREDKKSSEPEPHTLGIFDSQK